jgi:hypothetical protein
MSDEQKKAVDKIAEGQRLLAEGHETETREDLEKAKGEQPKRPWWKVWART